MSSLQKYQDGYEQLKEASTENLEENKHVRRFEENHLEARTINSVFSGDFPECNKISNVSILFQELKP
jgi:hypothetical protein